KGGRRRVKADSRSAFGVRRSAFGVLGSQVLRFSGYQVQVLRFSGSQVLRFSGSHVVLGFSRGVRSVVRSVRPSVVSCLRSRRLRSTFASSVFLCVLDGDEVVIQ